MAGTGSGVTNRIRISNPAASLVNLLRVLEANPAAITKLVGRMPRPVATYGVGPFKITVTRRHIDALTKVIIYLAKPSATSGRRVVWV